MTSTDARGGLEPGLRSGAMPSWQAVPEPNPNASLRLFCFPYAGGSASTFQYWRDALPAHVEVCGVELPGRADWLAECPVSADPRSLITRIPPLISTLQPIIEEGLDRPFAFFGHCLGAIVAFELARGLRAVNGEPVALFVSGRRAPQVPSVDSWHHQASDGDFVKHLVSLDGTPTEILQDPELLRVILPTIRADFELLETYRYVKDERLTCPIVAIGGADDPETATDRLDRWRDETTGAFSKHLVEGSHFFLQSDDNAWLNILRSKLTDLS